MENFIFCASVFRTLVYPDPWHILKPWHIQNPDKYMQ